MSALPPKADIAQRDCHVRFVPIADVVRRSSKGSRGQQPTLDAALRSGKLGPIEAEYFADMANRAGVKVMSLTN
jgi:hypothetical protein